MMAEKLHKTHPAFVVLLATTCAFSGCAYGTADYVQPVSPNGVSNEKAIEAPQGEVWDRAIPELAKHFFVFNIIDKPSGLINLSFSGDPDQYVDCGRIRSEVVASLDEGTYDFSGAKAHQTYKVVLDSVVWQVEREMSLEGRTNIIFQSTDADTTKVLVNTRYIVSRTLMQRVGKEYPWVTKDVIYFNSNGNSSFPTGQDGIATDCFANGNRENQILRLIH